MTESSWGKGIDDFLLDLQVTQETEMECLKQARRRQATYYNKGKKPAPMYKEGEQVLLLRKFITLWGLNSKLDYRYIGPFSVVKMIGKNVVELDIQRDYPKLHPVFNVSLIVRYVNPNSLVDQSIRDYLKEQYYRNEDLVEWSLMDKILDARLRRKGKYDYLVLWKNSTVANDVWIAEEHFPNEKRLYLEHFRKIHGKLFGNVKKKEKEG
jgi:hypothetical protein